MAKPLHCSFCGKADHEVRLLVAGPGKIHICDGCVEICRMLMQGEGEGLSQSFDPQTWPKERLLAVLAPVNATIEQYREHLQGIVEALRAQEVSWAVIAEKLGVSRQTAWERFS